MSWKSMYFLPEEISGHNTCRDCWLIIFGVVKDVTQLIEEYRDSADLIDPIVREAGQDVSFWFLAVDHDRAEIIVSANDLQ